MSNVARSGHLVPELVGVAYPMGHVYPAPVIPVVQDDARVRYAAYIGTEGPTTLALDEHDEFVPLSQAQRESLRAFDPARHRMIAMAFGDLHKYDAAHEETFLTGLLERVQPTNSDPFARLALARGSRHEQTIAREWRRCVASVAERSVPRAIDLLQEEHGISRDDATARLQEIAPWHQSNILSWAAHAAARLDEPREEAVILERGPVSSLEDGGVQIVRLIGGLTLEHWSEIEAELASVLTARPIRILLDLKKATSCDRELSSRILEKIAGVREGGGRVAVARVGPKTRFVIPPLGFPVFLGATLRAAREYLLEEDQSGPPRLGSGA